MADEFFDQVGTAKLEEMQCPTCKVLIRDFINRKYNGTDRKPPRCICSRDERLVMMLKWQKERGL